MSKAQISDEILFYEKEEDGTGNRPGSKWRVIIADDDDMMHRVTKMALRDFTFEGRGLQFLSAYSGAEALSLVEQYPDTALMILDVVMESEDAGLVTARRIREELKNKDIRIVLRTGQPGQAPEQRVIAEYDINDYKDKTELTAQKLHTVMYSSLRSYRDILALEANKRGLEMVLEATADISKIHSMEKFAKGVLQQVSALLNLRRGALYYHAPGLAATKSADGVKIIAGTGNYESLAGADAFKVLEDPPLAVVKEALAAKHDVIEGSDFVAYFQARDGSENIAYIDAMKPLNDLERNLVNIFCRNVSVAFENIYLSREIDETQRELVYRLSEAVETRSRETGHHVKRVAEYSRLLALILGMDDEEADTIFHAAPLHDVGKIGIPDSILSKPGPLSAEEWSVMKTHTTLGRDMLKNSRHAILKAAATIADEHHEKWDGSGYPAGRKGQDIHIYGRIVAFADVFDALGSGRCYKQPWDYEQIRAFLMDVKGRHLDPELVGIFFDRERDFLAIRERYKD